MILAHRWTNVILITMGVALVASAFWIGRGSILPNAIVGLILLVRGSRPKSQPLPILYIGVAATLLTFVADVQSVQTSFVTVIGVIVLFLLATVLFWEWIPILRRNVSDDPKKL
jgi:hypothetical protein